MCVSYDQSCEHLSGAVNRCDDWVSSTSDDNQSACVLHDGTFSTNIHDCENGSPVNSDYIDSADTVSDIRDTDDSVVNDLQEWAAKHNASHASVRDVLQIFNTVQS